MEILVGGGLRRGRLQDGHSVLSFALGEELADDWQTLPQRYAIGRKCMAEIVNADVIQVGAAWTTSAIANTCYAAPTVRDSGFK